MNNKVKYEHLLEVNNLYTSFNIPAGEVRSVNGVSFTVDRGEVLGIVGESGSGKSVTAYSIMQILQNPGRIVSGSIKFKGQELIGLPHHQLQKIRGDKIAIIFQDPMSSLNPVYTIGNQIMEAIRLHPNRELIASYDKEINRLKDELNKAKEANKDSDLIKKLKDELKAVEHKKYNYPYERALEMMRLVGINEPKKRLKQYPFEFSGGMLQRIMIAMALVCDPDLLIADEPTTALDVTIQAQILELLKDIQAKMGMGIIIITHDLGVVAQICDKVNVMYAGRLVEKGDVREIFYKPKHEYTKGLLTSIPKANDDRERLVPIEGNPVDVFCLPEGCSFAPRCKNCMQICLKKYPKHVEVSSTHTTACFKYVEEAFKKKKITENELKKIVDESIVGNAAFKPISHSDVIKAQEEYRKALKAYVDKKDNVSEEEVEKLEFKVDETKKNLKRSKRDLKLANKNRKFSRKERPSMERGDMAKHIKEVKKRVRLSADDVIKEDLYHYLKKLKISSYSIDFNFHREDVAKEEKNYLEAKATYKSVDSNNKDKKSEALAKLVEARRAYEDSADKYARNRKLVRKLLETRETLIKLNTARVKKSIKANIADALNEFKGRHLFFNSENELNNYLNKVKYTTWDFDPDLTRENLVSLKEEAKKNQENIYALREKNASHKEIDEAITIKDFSLYDYWFKKGDYEITQYYQRNKDRFIRKIKALNEINKTKKDTFKDEEIANTLVINNDVSNAKTIEQVMFDNKNYEKSDDIILSVQHLKMYFKINTGWFRSKQLKAVDDVSFDIKRGETLGLVGESGCGKTTLGRTILQLYKPTAGKIIFNGEEVSSSESLKLFRQKSQIVFQDPYSSLDPRMTVEDIIAEPLDIQKAYKTSDERHTRVIELMKMVGMSSEQATRYAHEFSGGQRQRIGIARSLALNPKFIVCDEPVSALDVSIQAQVINTFKDLQKQLKLTYIFVTHNLLVVKHIADRIAVMYLGHIVELADSDTLFKNPLHPYTMSLLSAIPVPNPDIAKANKRIVPEGDIPSPLNAPSGCPFRTRCKKATSECAHKLPQLKELTAGHFVACLYPNEITIKKKVK